MSLSDVMSSADLSLWTQAALVLFLAVFVAVVVRVFRRASRPELDRAAHLPLQDE